MKLNFPTSKFYKKATALFLASTLLVACVSPEYTINGEESPLGVGTSAPGGATGTDGTTTGTDGVAGTNGTTTGTDGVAGTNGTTTGTDGTTGADGTTGTDGTTTGIDGVTGTDGTTTGTDGVTGTDGTTTGTDGTTGADGTTGTDGTTTGIDGVTGTDGTTTGTHGTTTGAGGFGLNSLALPFDANNGVSATWANGGASDLALDLSANNIKNFQLNYTITRGNEAQRFLVIEMDANLKLSASPTGYTPTMSNNDKTATFDLGDDPGTLGGFALSFDIIDNKLWGSNSVFPIKATIKTGATAEDATPKAETTNSLSIPDYAGISQTSAAKKDRPYMNIAVPTIYQSTPTTVYLSVNAQTTTAFKPNTSISLKGLNISIDLAKYITYDNWETLTPVQLLDMKVDVSEAYYTASNGIKYDGIYNYDSNEHILTATIPNSEVLAFGSGIYFKVTFGEKFEKGKNIKFGGRDAYKATAYTYENSFTDDAHKVMIDPGGTNVTISNTMANADSPSVPLGSFLYSNSSPYVVPESEEQPLLAFNLKNGQSDTSNLKTTISVPSGAKVTKLGIPKSIWGKGISQIKVYNASNQPIATYTINAVSTSGSTIHYMEFSSPVENSTFTVELVGTLPANGGTEDGYNTNGFFTILGIVEKVGTYEFTITKLSKNSGTDSGTEEVIENAATNKKTYSLVTADKRFNTVFPEEYSFFKTLTGNINTDMASGNKVSNLYPGDKFVLYSAFSVRNYLKGTLAYVENKAQYKKPVIYISVPKGLVAESGSFTDKSNIIIETVEFGGTNTALSVMDKDKIKIENKGVIQTEGVNVGGTLLKISINEDILAQGDVESKYLRIYYKLAISEDQTTNIAFDSGYKTILYGTSDENTLGIGTGRGLATVSGYETIGNKLAYQNTSGQPTFLNIVAISTPRTVASIKIPGTDSYMSGTSATAPNLKAGQTSAFKVRMSGSAAAAITNATGYFVLPKMNDKTMFINGALTETANSATTDVYFTADGGITDTQAKAWAVSGSNDVTWTKMTNATTLATLKSITAFKFVSESLPVNGFYEVVMPFSVPLRDGVNVEYNNVATGNTVYDFGAGNQVPSGKTAAFKLVLSYAPTITSTPIAPASQDVAYSASAETNTVRPIIEAMIDTMTFSDDVNAIENTPITLNKDKSKITFTPTTGLIRLAQSESITDFEADSHILEANKLGVYSIDFVTTEDFDGQPAAPLNKKINITRDVTGDSAPTTAFSFISDNIKTYGTHVDEQMVKNISGQSLKWVGTVTAPTKAENVTDLSASFTFAAAKDTLTIDKNKVTVKQGTADVLAKLYDVSVSGKVATVSFKPTYANGNTDPDFLALAGKDLTITITTPFDGAKSAIGDTLTATMGVTLNGSTTANVTATTTSGTVTVVNGVAPSFSIADGTNFAFNHDNNASGWKTLLGVSVKDPANYNAPNYNAGDAFPGIEDRTPGKTFTAKVNVSDDYGNSASATYYVKFKINGTITIKTKTSESFEVLSKLEKAPVATTPEALLEALLGKLGTGETHLAHYDFTGVTNPPTDKGDASAVAIKAGDFEKIQWAVVGEYKITLVGTVNGDEITQEVVIKVVDTTAPIITLKKESAIYSVLTDFTEKFVTDEFITVFDNYDDAKDIALTFEGLDGVNFAKPGDHIVFVTAKDTNTNETTKSEFTIVTQPGVPVIKAETTISYNINSAISSEQFLKDIKATAEDEANKDILVKIVDFSVVKFDAQGTYDVVLAARNSVGKDAAPFTVKVSILGAGGGGTGGGDTIIDVPGTGATIEPIVTTPTDETQTNAQTQNVAIGERYTVPLTADQIPQGLVQIPVTNEAGETEYTLVDEQSALGALAIQKGDGVQGLQVAKGNPKTGASGATFPNLIVSLVAISALFFVKRKVTDK